MKQRDFHIDTIRGVACILLVFYHVVGDTPDSGLRIGNGVFRDFSDILGYIRMPLFTFLSGFVYACRPYDLNYTVKYIKGKSLRLLVPILTVGTVFAFLQAIVPGANASVREWWLIHIEPVGHFWYLEALFIIFMILIPLEKFSLLESPSRFIFVFAVFSVFFLVGIHIKYFSINGVFYLFPFFLLGLAMRRFGLSVYKNRKLGCLLISFGAMVAVYDFYFRGQGVDKNSIIGLSVGGAICFGIYYVGFVNQYIAKIGAFSYSIFLYHVFFTASSRIFLTKVSVESIFVLLICGLILGVAGPMLVDYIFSKNALMSRAFLGRRFKPEQTV